MGARARLVGTGLLLWLGSGCHLALPYGTASGAGSDGGSGGDPWLDRPPIVTVEALRQLSTPNVDTDPRLSPDGLTLFFCTWEQAVYLDMDVYHARRADRASAFGPAVRYDEVNTPASETAFVIARDDLTAYMARSAASSTEGSTIRRAVRSSAAVPFQAAAFLPVAAVTGAGDVYDPMPSWDHLSLTYTRVTSNMGKEVFVVRRGSTAVDFSDPQPVAGVNSTADDENPTLTGDGRVIVFASTRPGGPGDKDLYYAVRATDGSSYSPPRLVPTLNTAALEGEPYVSPDGRELYFVSDRPGGVGVWDIYRARIE